VPRHSGRDLNAQITNGTVVEVDDHCLECHVLSSIVVSYRCATQSF
jgi:hypothetical protein